MSPGLLRHFRPGVKSYAVLSRPDPGKPLRYAPTARHPEGREPRSLDIVQGTIDYADAGPTPFIGQVARVLPGSAMAEIVLIKRSAAKAKRLPYYRLQNLAAEACGLVFLPLDDLKLRSRAGRPVASHLRAAPSGNKPG